MLHSDSFFFFFFFQAEDGIRDVAVTGVQTCALPISRRIESNPLWNFIYGGSPGDPCDVEAAAESLREIPLDFILWRSRNSHRSDLAYDPVLERQGTKQLLKPLPWNERLIRNWDHNPYEPDGGSDLGKGDQTVWLLPYWMGRFHRLIE